MVSTPTASKGAKTTSSQTVASMSAHSGTCRSRDLTPAANPKCPAIIASGLLAWLGPVDEPGVEEPDDHDEQHDADDKGHGCLLGERATEDDVDRRNPHTATATKRPSSHSRRTT